MGRKIFVSYKYIDNDVRPLASTVTPPTWPCDYVAYLESTVFCQHIYKGEHQDEDLSQYSDSYIWNHLKDKMFDSSVTVLLISPNMKEYGKHQSTQWIPQELSYSLRVTTRKDYTSHRNSIVGVILPDKYGRVDYFNRHNTFPILKENIDNGYIWLTTWGDFIRRPDYHIVQADMCRKNTKDYLISINL